MPPKQSLALSAKYVPLEYAASFEKKSDLEYHMNSVHLKVKGYKCNTCTKSFVTKSMLKEHIDQKHSKSALKKKIASEKSGTSFDSKKNLESRSNSHHLKLKLFKCNSCSKYFSKKSVMLGHHRSTHKWPGMYSTFNLNIYLEISVCRLRLCTPVFKFLTHPLKKK